MTTRETTKKLITVGVIFAVVLIIVGYSYITSYGLIDGPKITLRTPSTQSNTSYTTVATSSFTISGVAKRVNSLTLNGKPIVIDQQGNFSEVILLFPGYTMGRIEGRDKFGRVATINLSFAYSTS